jgi:hypothetical protein
MTLLSLEINNPHLIELKCCEGNDPDVGETTLILEPQTKPSLTPCDHDNTSVNWGAPSTRAFSSPT